MIFNRHSDLKGTHAFLSPSQPHWLGYTEEKLYQKYVSAYAQSMGTSLHELAETLIRANIKLKKTDELVVLSHLLKDGIPRNVIDMDRIYNNFRTYVNDAVGFKMQPEQILYYSDICYGTADAISFRQNFLRIHDYKSGYTPAKMEQLLCYAALFCLEYKVKPETLEGIELRIYQNDEVVFHSPEAEEIYSVMDIIKSSDKFTNELRMEV